VTIELTSNAGVTMSKCLVNETGTHTFAHTMSKEESTIDRYLTCIACGERRAIGVMGDLLVRKNEEWVKLEPTEGQN